MKTTFQAFVATQVDKQTQTTLQPYTLDQLSPGEIIVDVGYSSLNYKDGLAVTGKGRVIHEFPRIPGIDLVGTIRESGNEHFAVGQQVIVTGWEIGERFDGGYSQVARVKPEWLVSLPESISAKQAMAIGTAGFTAMLCVEALEKYGCSPNDGDILVTGASGGVGNIAVAILASLGYRVVASTGRTNLTDTLKRLGAAEIVHRDEFASPPDRPLGKGRFAGMVDSVGGDTLANALSIVQPDGVVTAVGLAGGMHLNTTVLPFILRGVSLVGINSVFIPQPQRLETWRRLATDLPMDLLDSITQTIPLAGVPEYAERILRGEVAGRIVVDVNA